MSASISCVIPFHHTISPAPGLGRLPWHGLPKRLHHTRGQQKQELRGPQAASFAFALRLLIEPRGRAETTDQVEEGDDTKNAALTLGQLHRPISTSYAVMQKPETHPQT